MPIADLMDPNEVIARVGRGAALLDQIKPNWWKKINFDRFQFHMAEKCILGQVYGDYWKALAKVFPDARSNTTDLAYEHGFHALGATRPEVATVFKAAWRNEVDKRQKVADVRAATFDTAGSVSGGEVSFTVQLFEDERRTMHGALATLIGKVDLDYRQCQSDIAGSAVKAELDKLRTLQRKLSS